MTQGLIGWSSGRPALACILAVNFFVLFLLLVVSAWCAEGDIDSTFAYREIFLPPGLPSVALRTDETALLWNPAGIAMSRTYYLGYAWKGVYLGDHPHVISQFFLAKSKGFGLGYMHDSHSPGDANTYILTLAPAVSRTIALGFTGKWRGGFNFDCGFMGNFHNRLSVGFVARNLRKKTDARRYYEGGIAINILPHKLSTFFEVVNENSKWHKATSYGIGIISTFKGGMCASLTYFTDTDDISVVRATLRFVLSRNIIEGEYSNFTNDHSIVGARIVSHSP